MNKKVTGVLTTLTLTVWITSMVAASAQTAPGDFKDEPDKTLAKAHESFAKGAMDKASKQIHQAAACVAKESDKVAEESKGDVKKAGEELDKLGDGIKQGTVKSGDDINKCAASTDHALAKAWHATAEAARKSGDTSTAALKKAGASLEGAAKWSGTQLSEGTQASLAAVKKAGKDTAKGAATGADEVDKWFKGIGDGISDLGRKL
jgi:hypothetical protein